MDDLDEYADEDPPLSDSGDEDYTAVIQREEAAAAAAAAAAVEAAAADLRLARGP